MRKWYLYNGPVEHRRDFWEKSLTYLRPQLGIAEIDFFPQESWGDRFEKLGREVYHALNVLREAAPEPPRRRFRRKRIWMGERVDLSSNQVWEAYVMYGFHSIETMAWRRDDPPGLNEESHAAFYNHDSGMVQSVYLDELELNELLLQLGDGAFDPSWLSPPWDWPRPRRWFRR